MFLLDNINIFKVIFVKHIIQFPIFMLILESVDGLVFCLYLILPKIELSYFFCDLEDLVTSSIILMYNHAGFLLY